MKINSRYYKEKVIEDAINCFEELGFIQLDEFFSNNLENILKAIDTNTKKSEKNNFFFKGDINKLNSFSKQNYELLLFFEK